ncbi:MAG: polysaccharide deacetylase family protein [Acidobacteria bacterium]|nr:polysaccharide deacetylase family protein [Acidobacteriota bacterium]
MAQTPPIYVTLWFDTEDYILPQSDDAAKRLAEMLTRLGIKATFKIVGEKARVLEQRGRKDVIAALKKHEIGYHSNYHSIHPTPAEYLQNADWDEGVAEFYRREMPGVKDIQRIFGVMPSCYGQPGSSWGPQSHAALKQMGINVYLDDSTHVGIDEQPFYYGGLLNIFKMGTHIVRMDLSGDDNLAKGKAKFMKSYETLKAKGGGTISIYFHPCEWVHKEFWDGVNFSRGANPARKDWKLPPTRTSEETEKAFRDFEEYAKFIKAQAGVRYVTANELEKLYEDNALSKQYGQPEIIQIARAMKKEITFQQVSDFILSAADMFYILTEIAVAHINKNSNPIELKSLSGPAQSFVLPVGVSRPSTVKQEAFYEAVREVAAYCKTNKRMPSLVWIGSVAISPADYLATLAYEVERGYLAVQILDGGYVTLRSGNFTADKYVANDDPKIFGWVIHPEGFHAPKMMELAKLQAWTLKPAVMKK